MITPYHDRACLYLLLCLKAWTDCRTKLKDLRRKLASFDIAKVDVRDVQQAKLILQEYNEFEWLGKDGCEIAFYKWVSSFLGLVVYELKKNPS